MNVLVDVSAGKSVADFIRSLGHDTAFVRDRDPTLPDVDILAWAVAEGRLVVTMDKDFGDLVYRSGLPHSGVLLFVSSPCERPRSSELSPMFLRLTRPICPATSPFIRTA